MFNLVNSEHLFKKISTNVDRNLWTKILNTVINFKIYRMSSLIYKWIHLGKYVLIKKIGHMEIERDRARYYNFAGRNL